MPRTCTVCAHQNRDAIEGELLAGRPLGEIADIFLTSRAALCRHRQSHIPLRLLQGRKAVEISKADTLIGQIETLQRKARQILEKAESDNDLRTALAGVKELSRLIELVAKMTRELDSRRATPSAIELVDDATAERMARAFLERRPKERP
jgi:hypothetical protein